MYEPRPIDTSKIELPEALVKLTERLAENAHDLWAQQRLKEGWTYGPERDDVNQRHPDLVPYGDLPESEKGYDRRAAMETLKAIVALGYRIEGPLDHPLAGGPSDNPFPQEEPLMHDPDPPRAAGGQGDPSLLEREPVGAILRRIQEAAAPASARCAPCGTVDLRAFGPDVPNCTRSSQSGSWPRESRCWLMTCWRRPGASPSGGPAHLSHLSGLLL